MSRTQRSEVIAALNSERDYQDEKGRATDGKPHVHSIEEMLLYMDDYMTEAKHTASRVWGPTAAPLTLEIVRKVTALGMACMEFHGAPQRAGFERSGVSEIVCVDPMQDTYFGRLKTAAKLLRTLTPDASGYDHSEERGDSGGAYHEPMLPRVIESMEYRISQMLGGAKNVHAVRFESADTQLKSIIEFLDRVFPGELEADEVQPTAFTVTRLLSELLGRRHFVEPPEPTRLPELERRLGDRVEPVARAIREAAAVDLPEADGLVGEVAPPPHAPGHPEERPGEPWVDPDNESDPTPDHVAPPGGWPAVRPERHYDHTPMVNTTRGFDEDDEIPF